MVSSVTGAENRCLVTESRVEPRIFDGFGVFVEEDIVECGIVDMEFFWCDANNRSCYVGRVENYVVEQAYRISCAALLCGR